MSAEEIIAALDTLTVHETLRVHREACRRAARIYNVQYRAVRERNFELAMSGRDTRFVKGLSPLENIERCAAREHITKEHPA